MKPTAGVAVASVAGCWPTPRQQLLLRAALGADDEAAEAWHRWSAAVDLDRLDSGSVALLPAVSRRLQGGQLDGDAAGDAVVGRLRGLQRQCWYRNQIALRDASRVVRALAEVGVPAILVGGAAMALRRRENLAVRPIDDLGIAVPAGDVARGLAHLRNAGWRSRPAIVAQVMPRFTPLIDDGGVCLDLHQRLLLEDSAPLGDGDLLQSARGVEWLAAQAMVLDAAGQVLHICVHGPRWRPAVQLLWIADLAAILRFESVDWQRVVALARRHRVTATVSAALACLERLIGPVVPPAPLVGLAGSRRTLGESLERRVLERPVRSAWGGVAERTLRWRRIAAELSWAAKIARFPAFLAADLGGTRNDEASERRLRTPLRRGLSASPPGGGSATA